MAPAAVTSSYEIAMGAYRSWSDHRAIRIGAGVAYYWLFAIVPLTALAFHMAAAFFSVADIADWATAAVGMLNSTDPTLDIGASIETLLERTSGSFSFGIIGAVAAGISASFAFAATQDAVNMVWDAPKLHGFWENAIRRLVLFVAAVALASLLVMLLLAAAIVGSIESFAPGSLLDKTFELVSDVAVYFIAYGLIVISYRFMPWAKISWRPPLVAGAITVVALALATSAYGWYLDRSQQVSLAGAAGAVLASLVWMYVLAQVFVAGAELTRSMHERWDPRDPADLPQGDDLKGLLHRDDSKQPHESAVPIAADQHGEDPPDTPHVARPPDN